MKAILTIKTGKGNKSTKQDIDKTVDIVLSMGTELEQRIKGFKIGRCKIHQDGTSLILQK
jgi:hypothetical protein